MALVEVVVRVRAEQEDLAVGVLCDFSPSGFRHTPAGEDGADAEFGLYVAPDQSGVVVNYLTRAGIDVIDSRVEVTPSGWEDNWKQFHQPVQIGGLWVGPPWQADQAPAGAKRLIIEPGQGFGTGAHATTRLMLGLLLEQAPASVLDIGCGSGVLAAAAVLHGCGPVEAVDVDEAAIQSTIENLERNELSDRVTVRKLDVLSEPCPTADLVLANLTLEVLVPLAPRLRAPRILASGLLRSQVPAAEAAFAAEGYVTRERKDRDGWAALVLDTTNVESVAMRHKDVF